MADITNVYTSTYTTGYEDGAVRDIDSMIGLWTPHDTPFLAAMSSSGAKQRKVEWMADELEDFGENAQIEGFEAEVTESNAPYFDDNITQIFSKNVSITETAKAVDYYGRTSDLERQRGLRMKEISRDMEYAFLNGVKNVGSKTTPRKMAGAFSFVDTAGDCYYSFNDTPADTNHITEDILLDVMQGVWNNGLTPDTIVLPMNQQRKISSFTDKGRLTINQNATERKITMSVRLIQTDMGTVKTMVDRHIEETKGSDNKNYQKILVCQMNIFKRRALRPIKRQELAKTGDNQKELIVTEQTLQCSTNKGVASIVNLTKEKVA